MRKLIYLDNAATTRVCSAAAQAAQAAMLESWGNPSSVHHFGLQAQRLVDEARRTISAELGCDSDELFFCSGGTEANNLAVLGAARARKKRGNRVVISAIEHSSVDAAATQLEAEGFEVIRIAPVDGNIPVEEVKRALNEKTVLLSFMLVNNETGARFPVEEINRARKRLCPNAVMHCDCVQAFGKLSVRAKSLGCELISISGHKINAPKGIGGLYIKKGIRVEPIIHGGEQQLGQRPGTEAVPLIAAFGAAVAELPPVVQRLEHCERLNMYLRKRLSELDEPVHINTPEQAAPHILSIATGCIKSETMLNFMSQREIYISAGSACAKGKKSRVIAALGLPGDISDSTLRISFDNNTSFEEIDRFVDALKDALGTLVRFK